VETPGGDVSALLLAEAGEPASAYARRVANDLDRAQALLQRLTGRRPVAFAYPFGDWGATAAPGMADTLRQVLETRVELAFDQDGQDVWRPALPGDDRLRLHRLEVADWSGAELLAVLEEGAARGAEVYDERGLGYRYSELELELARARTSCVASPNTPIRERKDLNGERLVALTFNGGPSFHTAAALDILERYDVPATFFVRGAQVEGRERLLRRMLVEGNEIANGTLDGRDLADADDDTVAQQIDDTSEAIRDATGDDPCLVRPPFGSDAERVAEIADDRGLTTALWSVDPSDYLAESGWEVASRVLTSVQPGDVVVLHDGGGGRRDITTDALPTIVTGLQARGYRLVTVSELLAWKADEPECSGCGAPAGIDDAPMLARHVVSADGGGSPGAITQPSGRPGGSPAPQGTASGGRPGGGPAAGGGGGGASGGGSGGGGGTPYPSEPPLVVDGPQSPTEPPPSGAGSGGAAPQAPPSSAGGGGSQPGSGSEGGGGTGGGSGGSGSGGGGGSGGGSGGSSGEEPGSAPGEEDGGDSGTPPGHGGTPPGQGGTPPGQGGSGSGQGSAPPGHGGTPPGQGGTPPGQGKD
jgi:peptidoglycan/xylan/chitin deacetylase (PgdA/CDA1 family)